MNGLIARFWGFDKLIGSVLVKIVYYLGMAGIALGVLVGIGAGLVGAGDNPFGLFSVLLAPVFGAIMAVFWRFLCEISIITFEVYNRLGEIRDRLPAPKGGAPDAKAL